MLTKWAKSFLDIYKPDFIMWGLGTTKSCIKVKGATGVEKYSGIGNFNGLSTDLVTSITLNGTNGFAFGTGTTPPTENDYTIENIISSGLSFSATPVKNITYDTVNGKYILSIDFSLSNSTASDISISEICRFGIITKADNLNETLNSYVGNNFSVLLERFVYDNPIVVPAGEAIVLRYQYDFSCEKVS